MQPINNRDELFVHMQQGATLITPNNRLSHQLLNDYFKYNAQDVTAKPVCLPYQTFLQAFYKKALHLYRTQPHPLLINSKQQYFLWHQIISSHQESMNEGLLNEIQEAWKRCQLWQIDKQHPSFTTSIQTRLFQQWQQEFQQKLSELHAITEEQLVPHLLTFPELFHEMTLLWVCFDEFTPQQRALQEVIHQQNGQHYHYEIAKKPSTTTCYAAKDPQDEYDQMIHWVQAQLAQQKQRIAIVVPDLQNQYASLQRRLSQSINPEQFNISLGQPLVNHPLVAHALHWLTLAPPALSHFEARLLLHSSYLLGSRNEFIARAHLGQNSKLLQEAIIPFKVLIQRLNEYYASQLAECLETLPLYPEKAPVSEWIEHFKARLQHLGFPGDYSLDSLPYQHFQRFLALFDEFLQLSLVCPIMEKAQALQAFQSLAKLTIFQTKKPNTPLIILGLLEASGCTFDSLWICGLTDQCLPQKTKLSAFIPIDLQRNHAMPHSLPERELCFAEQTLQRLQDGSDESVFSYPQLTGDIPNLPSPLIVHLPTFNSFITFTETSSKLIQQEEPYIVPITENESISGGTALLANQAKCPFRAFAAHRLQAKKAPVQNVGLDSSDRGLLVHRIMDLLWAKLQTQQQLLALSTHDLCQHIENAIHTALLPLINEQRLSFSPFIQEIERERLLSLIQACFDWEKQRPAFVVEAVEQNFTLNIAGLDLRVRVDRIDRLDDDRKCVIDYKSTLPTNKPWNEERPEEPQLLLYSLLDENISALLFIELKAGHITLSGLTDNATSLPGISPIKKDEYWSQRRAHWRQKLSQLAREFCEGICIPQPTRQTTCQRCDFPDLCRIQS